MKKKHLPIRSTNKMTTTNKMELQSYIYPCLGQQDPMLAGNWPEHGVMWTVNHDWWRRCRLAAGRNMSETGRALRLVQPLIMLWLLHGQKTWWVPQIWLPRRFCFFLGGVGNTTEMGDITYILVDRSAKPSNISASGGSLLISASGLPLWFYVLSL